MNLKFKFSQDSLNPESNAAHVSDFSELFMLLNFPGYKTPAELFSANKFAEIMYERANSTSVKNNPNLINSD